MSVLNNIKYFFDGISKGTQQLSTQSYINLRHAGELKYVKKYLQTILRQPDNTVVKNKGKMLCHSICKQDFKEEKTPDQKILDTDMTDKNLELRVSEFCTNWLLFYEGLLPHFPDPIIVIYKELKEKGKLYLIKEFYDMWCERLSVRLVLDELESVVE